MNPPTFPRSAKRRAGDHAHALLLADACGADPAAVENIVVVDVPDAATVVAGAREEGVSSPSYGTGPSGS